MKRFARFVSCLLTLVLCLGVAAPAVLAAAPTDYTIIDPYAAVDWDTYTQYKANLHTHSTFSDGEFTLPDMVEKYYDLGFDILAMTDHGVINYGWNKHHNTFPPFSWANHVEGHTMSYKYHVEADMTDEDYERITTGADRGGRGMTDVVGGIEMNMATISKPHVNGLYLEEGSYGEGVWGIENDYAGAVEGVQNDGKEGYTFLNHVGDWLDSHVHPERAHDPKNIAYFANIFVNNDTCLGMEIVNGRDHLTHQDRALWDELLQVVIPHGRTIIGFSNDDSETIAEMGHAYEMIPLAENTPENVKEAITTGAFFCCASHDNSDQEHPVNGPILAEEMVPHVKKATVDQSANTITVVVDDARPCDYVSFIANGKVIKTDTELVNNTATIDLNDYEDALGCYIRFQIGSENGVTYSQPYILEYEGRVDSEIPQEALDKYRTPLGKLLVKFIQTRLFALLYLIWNKLH